MRAMMKPEDLAETLGEWRLVHRHGGFAPVDESARR